MPQTFICVSDCHIKINRDAPLEWSLSRYKLLFKEIIEACLKHKATLLLTGDILDRANPTLDELKLVFEFFKMIADNKIQTILISGNHEDIAKGVNVYDYLSLEIFGYIRYSDEPYIIFGPDVVIYPLDHDKLNLWNYDRELEGKFKILLSHFRATLNEFIKEEIDVKRLIEPFDICIAGDLHSEINLYEKLYYCNHPINSSFESNPNCSFILLTIEDNKYDIQRIATDLPSLILKNCTAEDFSNLELDPKHFYKVIVKGKLEELRKIPNKLPNAKIVKVAEDQIVYDSEVELEETEIRTKDAKEKFIVYMHQLGWEDNLIAKMMEELSKN